MKDIKKKSKAVDSELLIDDGEESYGDEIIENLGQKKLFQVPQKRPEYLRPQRDEREYMESQKGKNEIDWKGIVARANIRSLQKNKAPAFFSHIVGHGEVVDQHTNKTRYK